MMVNSIVSVALQLNTVTVANYGTGTESFIEKAGLHWSWMVWKSGIRSESYIVRMAQPKRLAVPAFGTGKETFTELMVPLSKKAMGMTNGGFMVKGWKTVSISEKELRTAATTSVKTDLCKLSGRNLFWRRLHNRSYLANRPPS